MAYHRLLLAAVLGSTLACTTGCASTYRSVTAEHWHDDDTFVLSYAEVSATDYVVLRSTEASAHVILCRVAADNTVTCREQSAIDALLNGQTTAPTVLSPALPPALPPGANPPPAYTPNTNPPNASPPSSNPPPAYTPSANPPPANAPNTNPPNASPPSANPPPANAPSANPPPANAPNTNPSPANPSE